MRADLTDRQNTASQLINHVNVPSADKQINLAAK